MVTLLFISLLRVNDPATVSTTFMLVVLLVAAVSELWSAVTVSVIAVLFFNYFFLPPVRTFTIADPQNWVALFAFLVVSLVASNLSARVRTREREALVRRDELARLFDLSRDVLMMTDSRDALLSLARSIGRRFDLECVALALPSDQTWNVFSTGPDAYVPTPEQLGTAFGAAKRSIEFDATTRSYAGHELVTIGDRLVDIVPLRSDTKPIGLLATSGRHVEAGHGETHRAARRLIVVDDKRHLPHRNAHAFLVIQLSADGKAFLAIIKCLCMVAQRTINKPNNVERTCNLWFCAKLFINAERLQTQI